MDTSTITTNDLLRILDSTKRLVEQRRIQPLLEYVATTVFDLIPAERCLIVLFGEADRLNVLVARNRQGQMLDNAEDQVSRSILEQARQTMAPLLISDMQADRGNLPSQSTPSLGPRSVMCMPLISSGQAIGAIYLENRSEGGRFSDANLVPLVLFSNQVISAFEMVKTYEELEGRVAERTRALQETNTQLVQQAAELTKLNLRDNLTGIYNRHHFRETIAQQFAVSRRYKRPLALAYLDIDHFKYINDRYFHATGDRVLTCVAQIIQDRIRAADLVARIGGEEFALVLPETPLQNAHFACNRLRIHIEQYNWSSIATDLRVTISVGVALDQECEDLQDLLHSADNRLYIAKRRGRNQVVAEDAALL